MNGLDGWTCSIFRNTGDRLSSELILAAEIAAPCGPDGMLTWVWPRRVASANPGWCFQIAGWVRDRWSASGPGKSRSKRLLHKPISLAGIPACEWRAA
jgi:hypothetical protein